MTKPIQRLDVLIITILSFALMGVVSNTRAATELNSDQYVIFYHHDLLGSPAVVTDHNGNTLWHEHSDPFGRARTRVSETGNEFHHDRTGSRKGYTGHLKDEGSNLVYMKARYFDPQIGRFYSNDPVGFSIGNPMMFNRYAYANNNPYSYIDPDGRNGVTALGGAITETAEGVLGVGDGEANYSELSGALADGYNGEGAGLGRSLLDDALAFGGGILGGAAKAFQAARGFFTAGRAGSIRNVNVVGGTQNCVNCAIATDATLAGRAASALPSGPQRISVLEKIFGGRFRSIDGASEASAILTAAGPGARGIVFGARGDGVGHVFNGVNQSGTVRFLDGQTGRTASFESFSSFSYLPTN